MAFSLLKLWVTVARHKREHLWRPALSSAQADHGQNKGWHPGLLYLWLVHLLSLGPFMLSSFAATLVSPAPAVAQAVPNTAHSEGQETGGESTGRLMNSCPFIHFWEGDTGPCTAMV